MRRTLLSLLFVAICFGASAQLTKQQQIQKLNIVYQQIRDNYVDDISLEPLVDEAIRATLKELDPHSQYLTKEEMEATKQRIRGSYRGFGFRYMIHNDTVVVRSVIPNSPALRADIQCNDRIVMIDNKSIVGLDLDSIGEIMRSDTDRKTSLTIIRRGQNKVQNISLNRESIETNAISSYYRIGDVGYIAISSFSKPVASEVLDAINTLGEVKSLIIDLRDNGGGALSSAIDLSSLFLQKGDIIVSTRSNEGVREYFKSNDRISLTMPLVVIINENSASASEIFAGAIQDHDRGVIVGRTSFGKGLVQRMIDLGDGSGLTLTVARYVTPSGRVIQRPYQMGKTDEYLQDSIRYIHPDSISHENTPVYTTINMGRCVYGGGGITPDIYIPKESPSISQVVIDAYINAAFDHAVIDLWDVVAMNSLREQYPTVESFDAGYMPDDKVMEILYRHVEFCPEMLTEDDCVAVKMLLKAIIAEYLYGTNARDFIYNMCYDTMLNRAVAIASREQLF